MPEQKAPFLDIEGKPLVEGAYYHDGRRNNVSSFHQILTIRKIDENRIEIFYIADERSEVINNPEYTRDLLYLGKIERISQEIKTLESMLDNFRREVAKKGRPS
jgi:hypothetical protein